MRRSLPTTCRKSMLRRLRESRALKCPELFCSPFSISWKKNHIVCIRYFARRKAPRVFHLTKCRCFIFCISTSQFCSLLVGTRDCKQKCSIFQPEILQVANLRLVALPGAGGVVLICTISSNISCGLFLAQWPSAFTETRLVWSFLSTFWC